MNLEYYKVQYNRLLEHNQKLEEEVDYWKARVGGRKPAIRHRHLGMRRWRIKRAIRLFNTFGICWFHMSKKKETKLNTEIEAFLARLEHAN